MASKKEKTTADMEKQAQEILKVAESYDVQGNFFFVTTFRRYLEQIAILHDLEDARKEYGAMVTKEYVKGRQNLTLNPAVSEYNKTSTAANNTVGMLLKIIDGMKDNDDAAAKELLSFINGR